MSDLPQFVKSNSVLSKLSQKPIAARWQHLDLVFIHGYPMTLKGFYVLCTKAIFGNTLYLRNSVLLELHAETKLLTQGLGLNLKEGQEAFGAIDGIRSASGWTYDPNAGYSTDQYVLKKTLLSWVESVEQQIATLRELTPLDPQPQLEA